MKWFLQFIPVPHLKIENYQDGTSLIEPASCFLEADIVGDVWAVSIVWMTPRKYRSLTEWNL